MSGFGDITKKATEFLKSEKAKDALGSQKAEDVSDKLLDGVAGVANRVSGGKHADKIEGARDAADRKIGTDGDARRTNTDTGDAGGTTRR